jgi:hypothetical protein
MNWFSVDKKGLADIVARRHKSFILFEMLQNAWDEDCTTVSVTVIPVPNKPFVDLVIEDDSDTGFSTLSHAFTLFAESEKKGDTQKRGRFNLGEKLVLSLCKTAEILSTTGGIRFDEKGRHALRGCRDKGSIITLRLRMSRAEMDECLSGVQQVIVPSHITTSVNGEIIKEKTPLLCYKQSLPTEISGDNGQLRRTKRITDVAVYIVEQGTGWLYEMGIPVVFTGDDFDVDVQQKIPVNLDRDNVSPAYLKQIRRQLLIETVDNLAQDSLQNTWIMDALSSPELPETVVKKVILEKFGEQVVSYDPNDPEANKRAVAAGYTVLHGRQFNKAQWKNFRDHSVVQPSSAFFKTPKPFSDDPDAQSLVMLKKSDWSETQSLLINKLEHLSKKLIGVPVSISIANDPSWGFNGSFSRQGCHMILNQGTLGRQWFSLGITEEVLALVIHELGHYYASDHLSSGYYDALCMLGARMALLGVENTIN